MKYKSTVKKNISGFKPQEHWEIILATSFVLFLLSIAYNAYLYIYAKKQVDNAATITSTTTTVKLSAFATPEKIQESFQIYKDRGVKYNEIINGLSRKNIVNTPVVQATTSTSTVIATTTNQ